MSAWTPGFTYEISGDTAVNITAPDGTTSSIRYVGIGHPWHTIHDGRGRCSTPAEYALALAQALIAEAESRSERSIPMSATDPRKIGHRPRWGVEQQRAREEAERATESTADVYKEIADRAIRERDEAIAERDEARAKDPQTEASLTELAEIHEALMDDWMGRESMTAAECVRRIVAERDSLQREVERHRAGWVALYRDSSTAAATVGRICDEVIDPSGRLLGEIRCEVRAAREALSEPADGRA